MKVLIACEESQRVCIEFRKLGHEAYSCDLVECSGNYPEWHIQSNVLLLINGDCEFCTSNGQKHSVNKWDLIIAHPPCTYLSNAGARWLYSGGKLNEDRFAKGLAAKEFFMQFLNADCEKIAVENPIPSKVYGLPSYSQAIQPYEFGDPYSKKTCLWLKGLPPLLATCICANHKPYTDYVRSSKSRSKTFEGVARAMADQWGNII